MKKPNSLIGQVKQASDLQLPVFAAGQMLRHDDLAALANYTRDITRLMLRSLFGCGVVCGLCVKASIVCGKLTVTVEPGVALDCEGDLIHVPKTTTVTVDPGCDANGFPGCLWVVLRGLQKCCAPRAVACSPDDDEVQSSCTREQYWYEIQVHNAPPECVCRCYPPPPEKTTKGPNYLKSQSASSTGDDEDPCYEPESAVGCYQAHEDGECACACQDCTACKCEWVMLARLQNPDSDKLPWPAEHRVRRFVRPALLQDQGCKPEGDETARELGGDPQKPISGSRGRPKAPKAAAARARGSQSKDATTT